MTEEEQRVADKYILEGRLAGLDLEEEQRGELANLHITLADNCSAFEKRVEVSSKAFKHTIHDPNVMREMPDQLIKLMAENKEDPSRGPWIVTLEPELYELFLEYCPDRNLSWNSWQAQSLDDSQLRNSSTLEKIRSLRLRQAQLLGYKSYAHLSMATKMAPSLEHLQEALYNMLNVAKPVADKELVDLQQFAWDRGFQGTLEAWDINFWQRKQKRTLFNYQEEVFNDYFPFDKVWPGLLAMCERVFGLKFVESDVVDRWHPDVRFFYIFEDSSKPIAGFFLDPYKRKDFWHDIMERLWKEHFMLPYDKWNSMPCSFTEIVSEQWGAAYYSHLWARMVAADVHSAFTEPDVDTSNIGSRFRDTYLSFGGSCHPGEVFRRFRGRDPSPHAFLKNLGLQ